MARDAGHRRTHRRGHWPALSPYASSAYATRNRSATLPISVPSPHDLGVIDLAEQRRLRAVKTAAGWLYDPESVEAFAERDSKKCKED